MLGGLALGSLGVSTLKRFGGVPDAEQSRRRFGVGTTKIVRKGVYSIVRHPQYLSWVFVSLALMLIAQDSSVVLFGIGSALALYMQARQDDESLLQKFGKEYADYMQVVPRMNPIVGILRRFRGAP